MIILLHSTTWLWSYLEENVAIKFHVTNQNKVVFRGKKNHTKICEDISVTVTYLGFDLL